MMFSIYALTALLAISSTTATPLIVGQDLLPDGHKDAVRVWDEDSGAALVLQDLERSLNLSLAIAQNAAKLGDDASMFSTVIKQSYEFAADLGKSCGDVSYVLLLTEGEQDDIYDAFELLGSALEGELDIILYKKDIINADRYCSILVGGIDEHFNEYKIYATLLSKKFSDKRQAEFLDLTNDPLSHKTEWEKEFTCPVRIQTWQAVISSLAVFIGRA